MNFFTNGKEVELIHTGVRGTVVGREDHDMVLVLLEDGDEIPVHQDDLKLLFDARKKEGSFKVQKLAKKEDTASLVEDSSQKSEQPEEGIYLLFEPYFYANDMPKDFKVYLLNNLESEILFSSSMSMKNAITAEKHGALPPFQQQEIGILNYTSLSENPSYTISIWEKTAKGNQNKQQISQKLKPKTFFKKYRSFKGFSKEIYPFLLLNKISPSSSSPKENLKNYTKKAVKHRPKRNTSYTSFNDIQLFASFEREIDLHIEKLNPSLAKKSNGEIVAYQMKEFRSFLAQAIRIGASPLFVIHGIGKGKLKNMIFKELAHHPSILKYHNEYHPKYGWGATEIHLK